MTRHATVEDLLSYGAVAQKARALVEGQDGSGEHREHRVVNPYDAGKCGPASLSFSDEDEGPIETDCTPEQLAELMRVLRRAPTVTEYATDIDDPEEIL